MAAVSAENLESWLPTEFLTEEVLLMDTSTVSYSKAEVKPTGFRNFSSDLLYESDPSYPSSTLRSPVESCLDSSPETERTDDDDDDDFIAGLTRRLTEQLAGKPEDLWVMAPSPKSTLNGIGSWSFSSNKSTKRVLSPPRTSFWKGNDALEFIYAATDQVARLNASSEVNSKNCNNQERSFLGPANAQNLVHNTTINQNTYGIHPSLSVHGHNVTRRCQYPLHAGQESLLLKSHCSSFWERQQVKATMQARCKPQFIACNQHQQIQSRGRSITGCENRLCVHSPGAWPPRHVHQNLNEQYRHHIHHQLVPPRHSTPGMIRPPLLGGSGVRRESIGTGVFLPRRYAIPTESKKKSARPTGVEEKLVQALNMNFDDITGNYQTQSLANNPSASDNARRNALSTRQRNNFSHQHAQSWYTPASGVDILSQHVP